jgi:ppGpp synthetase/RelA/SpoT-type nucleotidyltranferase
MAPPASRTVPDRLRAEYSELLPEIIRVRDRLAAEVRYHLLPVIERLSHYERVLVSARIKECESAVDRLRRDEELGTFDEEAPEQYNLLRLRDLAGVRVSVFPKSRLTEVHDALRSHFHDWTSDPFLSKTTRGFPAHKYFGYCPAAGTSVIGELQIVPLAIGLFWELEHDALYKPSPELRGIEKDPEMQDRTALVLDALRAFEDRFEQLVILSSTSGIKRTE